MIERIDAPSQETLSLAAITMADLRAGSALLPAGRRRAGLQESPEKRLLPLFAGHMLAFDLGRTPERAEPNARARGSALALASAAGCIAAAMGLAVATRDTGPFEAAGTAVINPWQA